MHKTSGGYISTGTPMVRAGIKSHTNALDRPISPAHIAALNAAQATPWEINGYVLDVAREAWTDSHPVGGVKAMIPQTAPVRKSDGDWAMMPDEERRDHRAAQASAHAHNASARGKEGALLECLTTAETVRGRPIWFPHSLDFRGRIYPVATTGLSPQGADLAKGLLRFHEGKPLGPDGMFWLCVRAANCFGQDKRSLVDRVAWTLEHREDIITAAADPFGFPWWSDAPEPWGFLATCHEVNMAWDCADPEEFVSHLPIPMDGSCSGIQHLSAMGLDPVGARATNLRGGLPRQDIYQEVADKVAALIALDLSGADAIAAEFWTGRVKRATVKRAVMTTPYGVTARGISQQLISDRFVDDAAPGERGALAGYLRDKLVGALGQTIVAAREIMAWLQEVATRLADAQIAFQWTTPVGSQIRQAYYAEPLRAVRTLSGQVYIATEDTGGSLARSKAASASAPNVIHSFDAAHCVLTVLRGTEEGISAWALVHDSFGTHASETTRLNATLRAEFVAMYRSDWLGAIRDEISSYAPHVQIPPLPAMGTFDLDEVNGSEFFFS